MENDKTDFDKFTMQINTSYEKECNDWNKFKDLVDVLKKILSDNKLVTEFSEDIDILTEYLNERKPKKYITSDKDDFVDRIIIIFTYNKLLRIVSKIQSNTFDFNELNKTSLISLLNIQENPNYMREHEKWNELTKDVNDLKKFLDERNIEGQIIEIIDNLYKFIDTHKPAKYITTTISDDDLQVLRRALHGVCSNELYNDIKR